MNKGITIAGNILTDKIKMIDAYPEKGMLVNISSASRAVGGCVPNTIMDLAIMDPRVPLKAIGMVGDDGDGAYVLNELRYVGVNVDGVKVSESQPTSFTDVMTVESNGERTFFHAKGANREFSPRHIDVDKLDCDIFHIGYLLLLDQFDRENAQFGTEMAALLSRVRARGIKTSIDVVSETGDRFKKVVSPALKHCDYVILNEIEAGNVAGIAARDADGSLNDEHVFAILRAFLKLGVKECVVVHCPEKGYAITNGGKIVSVPSLELPQGYIKGSVGAGDAFCAGMLYSLYSGKTAKEGLEFASCAAACNLSQADSVSGMRKYHEVERLQMLYPRKTV